MRLSTAEREAVLAVLDERIAAGADDLADALGLEPEEGQELLEALQSARHKLAPRAVRAR